MDKWLKTGTLKKSASRTEIRTTDLAAMEITVDQQDDNHEVQMPTDWPVQNWPALSPDLILTENKWGNPTRSVYQNPKQNSSFKELKSAIEDAWNDLKPELIQNLVLSMENRVFQLIQSKGAIIKY
ncbi:hypothetical protein AVEN_93378-1 [Araneus ventricosus]|uniref:Transposable element Tc1 transposase n=1 Tax=Araneus ventricosus TaxID=182803 RepID=A0A4Y2AQW4_ARAVE|nr:hypothetical protein AVEN_93378-1 [Araneus ventricosus]